jgi:heat shock protein HslJ
MRGNVLYVILGIVILSSLAGCTGTATPTPAATLTGNPWALVSYGDPAALIPAQSERAAQLEFTTDGKVGGNVGCNSLSGNYIISGDKIQVSNLSTTLMACADPLMQQEQSVSAVLNGAEKFTIEGTKLTLFAAGGKNVAVFEAIVPLE